MPDLQVTMPQARPNGTSAHPAQPPPSEQPTPLSTLVSIIHAQVTAFLDASFPPDTPLSSAQTQAKRSLDIIATARERYSLSELSLSFNGGKDCLVLLILFLAGLHPLPSPSDQSSGIENGETLETVPAIYAVPPDPFPSVEDFVAYSARTYHLSIQKYIISPPNSTLKSCFRDYLSLNPRIKAIFVGTRRTDPHGAKLSSFDRTDQGWPDFVRINPVLDWHYAEIWAFIRYLGLKYCDLYDQGYTSLGGRKDTHPNPKLRIEREEGRYRPAYELTEDLEERLGRD